MKKIDIRNKLIEIRESKGLSKRTVSEMTGIPYTTYIKYESGERKDISMDAIVKLAKFYGVTTDYLLGLEPPPNPFADLNLPPESEKEVLEKYMSFPPEIRACLLDALRKLGAAAGGDTAKPEPAKPEEAAPSSIADDMMDTIIKGEQMFSKAPTNKNLP